MSKIIWTALYIFGLTMTLYVCATATPTHPREVLEGLPLYYWQAPRFINFGDYLSLKIVERITGGPVAVFRHQKPWIGRKKLLAVGSVLSLAKPGDIVWGSGLKRSCALSNVDIRAVRGPLTREILLSCGLDVPEVYGDPALLLPYLFPEFKKKKSPSSDYVIIPHYSENHLFSKEEDPHVVYATDPWDEILERILDSKLVIASSLHGIIVAEAYGIPARWLRVTDHEPISKYHDYYLGTNRDVPLFALSVQEALAMGGVEEHPRCDLEKLYYAFPFEFWPSRQFPQPNFIIPAGE